MAPVTWLTVIFVAVVVVVLAHAVTSYALGRRQDRAPSPAGPGAGDDLFFVFVIPCLNEEMVVERTVRNVLAWQGPRFAVLVVDDGSDDGTVAAVERIDDPRVWLYRRTLPEARLGKGVCLNAAFSHLLRDARVTSLANDRVIVGVLDADGRLDPDAYHHVAPIFAEPDVAGVQVQVRIRNAADGVLARLQDMEFGVFTEVFQQARSRLGTCTLGGNGQFIRLSALVDLRPAPWSDCLAEDLDVGIRLLVRGHRNLYSSATWVSQQGLTSLRRLLRQRTRWFQGHLQCWRHIPAIRRGPWMSPLVRKDQIFHLLSPLFLLTASLAVAGTWAVVLYDMVVLSRFQSVDAGDVAAAYLLGFVLVPVAALAYRRVEPGIRFTTHLAYAHALLIYSWIWIIVGWIALGRTAVRHTGWAKTERSVEGIEAPIPLRPQPAAPARWLRRAG